MCIGKHYYAIDCIIHKHYNTFILQKDLEFDKNQNMVIELMFKKFEHIFNNKIELAYCSNWYINVLDENANISVCIPDHHQSN